MTEESQKEGNNWVVDAPSFFTPQERKELHDLIFNGPSCSDGCDWQSKYSGFGDMIVEVCTKCGKGRSGPDFGGSDF